MACLGSPMSTSVAVAVAEGAVRTIVPLDGVGVLELVDEDDLDNGGAASRTTSSPLVAGERRVQAREQVVVAS